ncbi:MAG TPA: hypothetical protein PL080_02985 [Candidatus Syntrophosphaera thermopropionivorans]|jgi:hypothetical protein|nr:hypothetical protein [Candidatus Syntrophosphaera sp.]MBP7932461.1 hypothetical protein [Candidatus Syntrophosphaera sp.]HPW24308.1 hypothetical protein [Candidatus Syntrophosphaera thermopropionivorans]HRD00102.1 hypothetical protein [Candidatus Syntrophosphaera thermopropionivorans]
MSYDLFVDLRAIQNYIFSSNKLKDNIGASYIVSTLLNKVEGKDLCKNSSGDIKSDSGSENNEEEKGFCGGGNLYLQCKTEDEAKNIVRNLSKRIFEKAPGLSFNAVILKAEEEKDFSYRMQRLYQKMAEEKRTHHQITTLPSYGINAQCSAGPLSAQYLDNSEGSRKYISEVVQVKRIAAKRAESEFKDKYKEALGDDFEPTDEFLKISPLKGEDSHIAVVHIDGNGIGAIFSTLKTLSDYQEFSNKLNNDMQQALRETIKILEDKIRKGEWDYNYKTVNEQNILKYILPLRPIYIGGDDITFVCEGRLGIELSCIFIEEVQKLLNRDDVSFCAGVAIAKTNFPFFQIYKAADALCRSAKNKRLQDIKEEVAKKSDSYIDFHMINSSVYSNLEKVRKIQYTSISGKNILYYRPYKLSEMKKQIENAKNFARTWPNSKLAKFREVLYKSKDELTAFKQDINTKINLPLFYDGFQDFANSDDFFFDNKTIFLDIIELIDLLPEEL